MKLKWLSFILFFCFLFAGIGNGISFGGDECPEVVDQQQLLNGTSAGFGEFDDSDGKEGVRYRGQGFTPELPVLTAIKFNLECVGSTDLRVFIDTADQDSLPDHDIGGAIYSWTIPNSELVVGLHKYELPQELNLTVGEIYVIYFAPYLNGSYCDDYRNTKWSLGDPYCGGDGVVNINGCWSLSDNGNIDLQFKTYGRECSDDEPTPTPTPTGTEEPTPIPTPTDDGGGGGGGGDDGGGGGGGGKELRIISTKPGSGEVNVDPNLNKIEVNFNLAMDESGFITASAIELKEKESGTKVTASYVEVSYGGKVSFHLTSDSLVSGVKYEVKIIKDRVKAGVGEFPTLIEDYIFYFTTKDQPTPTPTPTVEPTASPIFTPTPIPTPSVEPSPIFTPTPIPTPSVEPSPSPTPTPTPVKKGVIYGLVLSIHDDEPLDGVKVSLFKKEKSSEEDKWVWKEYATRITEDNGKYKFKKLPFGKYKLEFSKHLWITIKKKLVLKSGRRANYVKEVNITLDP